MSIKGLIKLGVIEDNRRTDIGSININNLGEGGGAGGGGGAQTPEQIAAAAAKAEADAAAAAAGGAGGGGDAGAGGGGDTVTTLNVEDLDEAQQAIVTQYEGATLNSNGDVLNAAGEIIKTKADIDAAAGGDEEEYSLNDAGDLVDSEGKVVVAAADLVQNEDGTYNIPETPLVTQINETLSTQLGFQLQDENGNPLVFEDTDEGITNMVKAYGEQIGIQAHNAQMAQFPDVQKFHQHIAAGNSKESFFTVGNKWRGTTLPADTEVTDEATAARKSVIVEQFLANYGYDQAQGEAKTALLAKANKIAGMFEDDGTLVAEANSALKNLQAGETAAETARDTANAQAIADAQKENEKQFNQIVTTVNQGNLGNLVIPQADRQQFLDYISKDVTGKGQSQEMLDRAEEDMALTLQLSYMRYKGFDLSALASLVKDGKKAKTLSQRRAKTVKVVRGGRGSGGNKVISKPNVAKININNM